MNWSDIVSIISLVISLCASIFLVFYKFQIDKKMERVKAEWALTLSTSQTYMSLQFSTINSSLEKLNIALGYIHDFSVRFREYPKINISSDLDAMKKELSKLQFSENEINFVITTPSFERNLIQSKVSHVIDMKDFNILRDKFLEFHNELTTKKYLFPEDILILFEELDENLTTIARGYLHFLDNFNYLEYDHQMAIDDRWGVQSVLINEIDPKVKALEAKIRDLYNLKKI